MFFYRDPLSKATEELLLSVQQVAAAIAVKKKVIEDARLAVEEANRAIDEAQAALSSR